MEKLSGREIRDRWIRFFESKGHRYIPGVSLIPQGDKSLLWVNAGVTGLKKYFDGTEVPPCRRIVNVQKSIRTNDIAILVRKNPEGGHRLGLRDPHGRGEGLRDGPPEALLHV